MSNINGRVCHCDYRRDSSRCGKDRAWHEDLTGPIPSQQETFVNSLCRKIQFFQICVAERIGITFIQRH